MAREAGFHQWYTMPEEHPYHVAIIERFAALVAAAEREACAQLCENLLKPYCDGYGSDGEAYAEEIRARK